MQRHFLIFLLVSFPFCLLHSQKKEKDLPLANNLKSQYGDKSPVVCLKAKTVVTFDTLGSSPRASINKNERFISLKDNYTFTNFTGCDEYVNVSDIKVYEFNDKPLYTTIIDQSNENGESFYSDERIRIYQIYFESVGSKRSADEQTIVTDLKYISEQYFVNSYPIVNDSIVFKVPTWLKIDIKEMNFDDYDIQKNVTQDAKNSLTIYTYIIKNTPAVYFNEPNVPGNSYMFPHVLVMCKSYTKANGQNVNILSSIDDMYQWYEKLIKETGNDINALKPLVNTIIAGKTTDKDKAKAIYYWVENNIRYLAFENGIVGYKPAACQTVVNNKYGDCKCMGNLLTEMLKLAGLDARRAWLGTKGIAYDLSTPSLAIHNHAICVLILNGKHYYLDATAEYGSLGYDNDMIQGRDIIFENGDTYTAEKIPVAPIENNRTEINKVLTIDGDLVSGNAHYNYNGDSKTLLLYEFNHALGADKDKNIKRFIEYYYPNMSLLSSKTSDLQNWDVPVSLNYTFTVKNQVTKFDNDIYVGIDYDKALQNMQFDSNRHCDYEFDFRLNYNINDTLVVPAGYTIKHVPDDMAVSNPDYSFTVKITHTADKIIYHKEIKVMNEIIRKKDFVQWNAAIKQLKNIYEDQVILTKS